MWHSRLSMAFTQEMKDFAFRAATVAMDYIIEKNQPGELRDRKQVVFAVTMASSFNLFYPCANNTWNCIFMDADADVGFVKHSALLIFNIPPHFHVRSILEETLQTVSICLFRTANMVASSLPPEVWPQQSVRVPKDHQKVRVALLAGAVLGGLGSGVVLLLGGGLHRLRNPLLEGRRDNKAILIGEKPSGTITSTYSQEKKATEASHGSQGTRRFGFTNFFPPTF